MRQEFVEVSTVEAAQTACPWAAEIVEVEGGFQAFESMTDYNNWVKNTDQETEDGESEDMPSVVNTNLKTADGLTVYDLDPQASELWAVAGPSTWIGPIDTDALPEGFRWVTDEEWAALQDAAGETEEESEDVPSVEVCSDLEWVRENELWHRERIDESDLEDAASTYNEAVYKALADKGWDVSWAKGQRMFFHGWNGAHFPTKCGCVGSWAKLTDEQVAVIDEARKLADDAVMATWAKTAGETRQDVVQAVEAANLCCPADVCDAVLTVWEAGGDWRAELAEAVKNDAVVAKQIGLE